MSTVFPHPSGFDAVHAGGADRLLACLPPNAAARTYRAAFPKLSDALPLIPRSKWKPLSRRSVFTWVLDQGQHGSCTDHGACYAHRKQRVMQGMTDVELSATFGYAQVNGGQDNGASISDLLPVMQQLGRCLMTEVPEAVIYKRSIPQSAYQTALRFRITTEVYSVTTFDEAVSALLQNFIPVYPVMVGNAYNRFDGDNCCGVDRGPGNHCVHADGLYQRRDGTWALDHLGSWGSQWAQNGRAGHVEGHFNVQPDGYAFRVALDDPQDPNAPPAAQP